MVGLFKIKSGRERRLEPTFSSLRGKNTTAELSSRLSLKDTNKRRLTEYHILVVKISPILRQNITIYI